MCKPRKVAYPSHMPAETVALVKALLVGSPSRRLGGGEGQGRAVEQHSFLSAVDFSQLLRRELAVPIVPVVSPSPPVPDASSNDSGSSSSKTLPVRNINEGQSEALPSWEGFCPFNDYRDEYFRDFAPHQNLHY